MSNISLSDLVSQISIGLDAVEADLLGATPYHSKRVAIYCLAIGKVLGFDEKKLFSLAACALLHDNALTEYILSEQSNASRALNLKTHCIIGQENCNWIPLPHNVDGFILYHHENADGSGIFGKHAGEYPQEAAIIALADQIDVHYHLQSFPPSQLVQIQNAITKQIGKKYERQLAEAALTVLDRNLLHNMKNDVIHETLKQQLPNVSKTLSNRDIVGLSGITAKIIDYKSKFTQEHTTQIANKAWYMAKIYHYDETACANLFQAAALHDIGKLFIPTAILEKPGKLTEEEFAIIKTHVSYTWELLRSIRGFDKIAVWASDHHEKLDGSGYPFGKKASELDFNSRLLACLDIYQAVRETRPYHPGRSHADTMKILYDMVQRHQIDGDIAKDLDQHLKHLEDGCAPPPDLLFLGQETEIK